MPPFQDDEDDEDYTYTSVPDSKLDADSDGMSLSTMGTSLWADKGFSPRSVKSNNKSKSNMSSTLAIRTESGACTVAEGALSPIRKSKRQKKTSNPTAGKKRCAHRNLSSNGTVG